MPRQTRPLTATEVEKAKPKDKNYRLYDGEGLVLNITTSNTRTWYLQYTRPFTGKKDMVNLGRYPAVSLADARKQKIICQELLAKDIDPKQHFAEEARRKAYEFRTDFKSVFEEWLASKSYSDATLAKMNNYIAEMLAVIGNKPVNQVTTADCMAVLKPVESAGHYAKLDKMRSMISQTMAFAIATGRADSNPAIHLRGVFKSGEVSHNPAILDMAGLEHLAKSIYAYHGHFSTRKALLFNLITFARPGEVRHLKWDDIDFDKGLWSYTPNKTRRTTKVQMMTPLASQSLQILQEMREFGAGKNTPLVFPSTQSILRPLSENTLNQALRRLGFDNSEQTSQGFRAIARTLLEEEFKYDYRMIEMQLGHQVRDPNGRAYNRIQWLDDRRVMMQHWADFLFGLIEKG